MLFLIELQILITTAGMIANHADKHLLFVNYAVALKM